MLGDDDDDDADEEGYKRLACTDAKLSLDASIEIMELTRETKTICGSNFAPHCDSACWRASMPELQELITMRCGDSDLSDETKARLERFDRDAR